MNKRWYYADNGATIGPFGIEDLKFLLRGTPNWRDTLVWGEGDDHWQKAGSISDFAESRATPPPIPKEQIQENVATTPRDGYNAISRKATFWLIALYFLAALSFSFYVRMSRPFARIDSLSVAEAFGGALGLFLGSGLLPMIVWGFRRFRSEVALTPMALWCTLLFVFAVLDWQSTQVQREVDIEQIGRTVFTGKQREELMKQMKSGCMESMRKTPAITAEQINAYCGCTAAAVAVVVTSDEIAYAARHSAYPPSMLEKLGVSAPQCIRLLGK